MVMIIIFVIWTGVTVQKDSDEISDYTFIKKTLVQVFILVKEEVSVTIFKTAT